MKPSEQFDIHSLEQLFSIVSKSNDFSRISLEIGQTSLTVSFYPSMSDTGEIHDHLLPCLHKIDEEIQRLEELKKWLPFDEITCETVPNQIANKLQQGYVVLQLQEARNEALLINISHETMGHRTSNDTENEFSVIGPKTGFVENLSINLHLLRQQIAIPQLIFEELTIGSLSKTTIVVAYIEGLTNPEIVQTMKNRLKGVDMDIVYDSSFLEQVISDNTNTPFPLFLTTERIDRIAYVISSGQIALFTSGSPYVLAGPSTFMDFFISPEDYYLNWITGSFFRVIRLMSVFFSLFASPIYIAVLTFHYEMIPSRLLQPIMMSGLHVPFSPVIEVVFLETTIELLREAGARLPAKIGQTLGIVGGIVIGEASVQASLTSNILLIIVALSALASFTTPIFKMANTIRVLRFPLILFSALLGGLGIAIGFTLLLAHLLRLKSLDTPYMVPFFPFRKGNLSDSLIRASYQFTTNRILYLNPLRTKRYQPDTKKEDIEHDD
ncbi:GerA spore germination protein [Paenibacillus taihuensis]|uniref:GerA spore germination protein n=1 Tax=Paenibacillus taihuensis TaxID=1156355 RepID=A0A3D9RTI3_9BACL|nr:spore germination protein [Paenibacillus taihuensis]REE81041.1 GerA spore germination protein [Paenibacillus taihuensis]